MSPERPATSRALIVDDHPIITDALAAALVSLRVVEHVDKEMTVAAAMDRLRTSDAYDMPWNICASTFQSCR